MQHNGHCIYHERCCYVTDFFGYLLSPNSYTKKTMSAIKYLRDLSRIFTSPCETHKKPPKNCYETKLSNISTRCILLEIFFYSRLRMLFETAKWPISLELGKNNFIRFLCWVFGGKCDYVITFVKDI